MANRRKHRLYIPDPVKASISRHIYQAVAKAIEGYLSGSEDEDVLTGNLGANLRITTQKVRVQGEEVNGTWTWSIEYYKFRGRGLNATEKLIGADGIFELVLDNSYRQQKKSLLFQAKNNWTHDLKLLQQSIRLSNWREAAFVLNYLPNQIEAYSIDEVIKALGTKTKDIEAVPLADYLSRYFLECLVGDTNLNYDAVAKKLIWKTVKGKVVSTQFSVNHRIALKVNPPRPKPQHPRVSNDVPTKEIYNHRMQASNEEILSLGDTFTLKDVQKARKNQNSVYHPDRFKHLLEQPYIIILTRRSQEVNVAVDELNENKS